MTPEIKIYPHRNGKRTRYSFLPFPLPAGKSGNWEVEIQTAKKGSKLTVVSMRNAIFMGLEPTKLNLTRNVDIHTLTEYGCDPALAALGEEINNGAGTWMTSRPQELEQHTRQLARAHGSVLVGGLGLGLAAGILHDNDAVTSVTVVELSDDVITLVKPYLPKGKIAVFKADIMEWLKMCAKDGKTYDFAFYDTWCPTGQFAWGEYVMPLRQASIGIVRQDMIECWNEGEMIGQIAMSLNNWVGPEREVMRNMMIKQMGKSPWEMDKKEFADFAKYNREIYPFMAWKHANKPNEAHTQAMAQEFISNLKNAVEYNTNWKQWESYGK